jgi:hypothetical protein
MNLSKETKQVTNIRKNRKTKPSKAKRTNPMKLTEHNQHGYCQIINSPTRGEALLDVYLVRPGSSVTPSGTVQGVIDHMEVILKVEWEDTYTESQVERVVPVYNKTDVVDLQIFLHDKFTFWASNGRNVE